MSHLMTSSPHPLFWLAIFFVLHISLVSLSNLQNSNRTLTKQSLICHKLNDFQPNESEIRRRASDAAHRWRRKFVKRFRVKETAKWLSAALQPKLTSFPLHWGAPAWKTCIYTRAPPPTLRGLDPSLHSFTIGHRTFAVICFLLQSLLRTRSSPACYIYRWSQ